MHEKARPKPVIVVNEATLFMVGDALLHNTVYDDGRTADGGWDFTHQIDRIGAYAKEADLAYYNQETILGGTALGLSSYPSFNSPQEWGRDMIAEGFNLVSTATNHSLDRSTEGIEASKAFWNSQEGVVENGTHLSWDDYYDVPIHEINGITYAFISYTYGMNGLQPPAGQEYLVSCYTGHVGDLIDQVREGKEKADVVIVAIHWGTESYDMIMKPNSEQLQLAQQLSDAGADIIIGNHPHVVQTIEWINDRTICFYALGNLISDQYLWEHTMIGAMASLKIVKTSVDDEVTISIEDIKADLHYTYLNRSNHTNFQVIPFSQLTDDYYPGYQEVYERYKAILTEMDAPIEVGGF